MLQEVYFFSGHMVDASDLVYSKYMQTYIPLINMLYVNKWLAYLCLVQCKGALCLVLVV